MWALSRPDPRALASLAPPRPFSRSRWSPHASVPPAPPFSHPFSLTPPDADPSSPAVASKKGGNSYDMYLGLLYPTEEYRVYGYVTNSRVKIVLVLDGEGGVLKDPELRSAFRKLHAAYIDVVANPFYIPCQRISSARFDALAAEISRGVGGVN